MKNSLLYLALVAIISSSLQADDLNSLKEDTESIYRTGAGAEEGVYNSLSLSMLGWGIGLAAGIGILASVLHQSTSSSSHDSCTNE